jgi:Alginate export
MTNKFFDATIMTTERRIARLLWAAAILPMLAAALPIAAQDDVTTQNAASALDGGWITGPASNPLSHLNGPAFRTTGSAQPYDVPDFAPITDLDARLPHWIAFQAEERYRYEADDNASFKAGSDDSYELNRFRLEADVKPNSWFRVTAQLQDARPFFENPPIGPPNENRWDLKLAYTEIGDPEKHWFSLRVGRQIINYNNTIIADSQWRDQGRSFDAAVLNLQSSRASVGLFAASAVVPQASGLSPHQEGNNIYGAYGRIKNPLPNSSLEPFVLWRVQPSEVVQAALSKTTGKQDEKAYGVRLKGRAGSSLDYSGEVVVESGTVGTEPIRAWASSEGAAYQFKSLPTRPRFFVQHDFATGTSNPSGGVHRTFDTMYPTAHDRFGIDDQFGWQNIQSARAGGTFQPHHRWSVTAQGLDFWAVSALDAVYNTSGGSIVANKTDHGLHIGEEADVYTWYELNRHFNLGGGYGWFGGGDFLSHVTNSHDYSYSYIVLNFKDNGRKARE